MATEDADASQSVLRHRGFMRFWCARVAATIAFHIMAVSIGWQLYTLTGSALDLGLVGLAQFLPLVPLTLAVGYAADRFDRRIIIGICELSLAVAVMILLVGTASGWLGRNAILGVALLIGAVRAFEIPTMAALLPTLVPHAIIPKATAWWASANQTAQIVGPAIGGFLYAVGPSAAYGTSFALFLAAAFFVARIPRPQTERKVHPVSLSSLFSGFDFIRRNRILLGTISLDLVAVLFGAAVALLPIFARDVLGMGPEGLGLLRSAPAAGALITSIVLARMTIKDNVGKTFFIAVGMFGFATAVFGMSTNLWLSMAALAVVGASDVVSVVIRSSLVQMGTPDALRGRVSSANSMFIGTSNQLGEFRAGAVAAMFGAVPAVIFGGLLTVAFASTWMFLFPELRKVRKLYD